jgi:hypothetical protein
MNAKQFAWTYLVESGCSDVYPSYYGGYANLDGGHIMPDKIMEIVVSNKKKILDIGVDWDATKSPISDRVLEFTNTFNAASVTENLVGTLMLKDGTSQEWIADAIDTSDVFELLAAAASAKEKFDKLFGE